MNHLIFKAKRTSGMLHVISTLAVALSLIFAATAQAAKPKLKAPPTPTPTSTAVKPPSNKPADDAPIGWEKVDTDEAIDIYRKEIDGDPVVALRGEGIVDASISRVASVILDKDRATEWVAKLKVSKLLKMTGERAFLQYIVVGAPAIISNRDFVNKGFIDVDLTEKTVTVRLTPTVDPLGPVTEDNVRGTLDGYYKMRAVDGGKKTYVIAEMHADPKGSLPKFVVNFFQRHWAKDTIEALRKQVAKDDIKIIPAVGKLLGEPGAQL
jgi:hypothetical protein